MPVFEQAPRVFEEGLTAHKLVDLYSFSQLCSCFQRGMDLFVKVNQVVGSHFEHLHAIYVFLECYG